jgi:gamma-glutamyltranspeptidase/glutathione hydrolase
MSRDFQLPGRSAVVACEGMAATSHPLATLAAIDVLRAGGNAVDAAIAAVAVLCVVEPHMTGIGGDCFCLISEPGKPVWGYNGSGRAAANASIEPLLARGMRGIPFNSPHAVTVPGAVEAWGAILGARGRFALDRALAPAIRFAEGGFPLAPRVARDWSGAVDKLSANPGAKKHYLPHGRAPAEGDVIRQPALAATLKAIAKGGPRAFYEGPIAADMVATLAACGSALTAEDFARHRGDEVAPISTNYRGVDLVEIPPNGQGLTALVMLNILEQFDLGALDPLGPDRFHLMLEAARLAFAVRDTHLADPAHMRVSVPALNDKAFAKTLASRIDRARRVPLPTAPTPGSDTVYLTVVDRDRTAVSLINSLFSGFGSGICTEETGIMFNNRGSGFVLDPSHPNAFGPGKRPMHTIIPALAMRSGRCDTSFGVMGAHFQPMGHVQMVLNLFDYGMDVQAAIDAPRAFFEGDLTVVERGIPVATRDGLKNRGHRVVPAPAPWGGAQAIRIDWERGVLIGGSDPRKDGCALGY